MRSVTGIEFGPDRCVMVRVRDGGARAEVSAVYGVAPDDVRPGDRDFVARLRDVRRAARFPRRARVVAWGIGTDRSPSDPVVRVVLEPLRLAGFAVESVSGPVDALMVLARKRTRLDGSAEVWLVVNEDCGALAVVLQGGLRFSRTLEWSRRPPALSPREELLHRYLLVARLAPEIRHACEIAGAGHAVRVERVITCGTLPDLRSLTMPLIEELGTEIETLDSLDGLSLTPAVAADAGDRVAAIRLACAAAGVGVRPRARLLPAAAAVVLAAGAAAAAYYGLPERRDGEPVLDAPISGPPGAAGVTESGQGRGASGRGPGDAAGGSPAPVERPNPARADPAASTTPSETAAGAGSVRDGGTPLAAMWERAGRTSLPGTRGTVGEGPQRGAARGRLRTEEPLPTVNSILVSPERRAAVLDGQVVREGDRIGGRLVLRIAREGVTVREPSGREVLLTIRRSPRQVEQPGPPPDFP